MTTTRNEAGWRHTRKKRQAELAGVVDRAHEWLLREGAGERVTGVLLVVIEQTSGQPVAHQAAVAYGEKGLRCLVEAADETLIRVAGAIQAAEDARRESRVRGRKDGKQDA